MAVPAGVARVRPARLLTILSSISRIVPVRGREDAAAAQVGQYAAARETAARDNAAWDDAAKGAERVTGSQAARRQQLGGQMQRSVADGEPLKYSGLNHEPHRLDREISGQSTAAGLIERLNGQLVRHQYQLSLRPAARRPRRENTWRSSLLSLDDSPTKPSTPCATIFTAS
jgi:hypothetical protein